MKNNIQTIKLLCLLSAVSYTAVQNAAYQEAPSAPSRYDDGPIKAPIVESPEDKITADGPQAHGHVFDLTKIRKKTAKYIKKEAQKLLEKKVERLVTIKKDELGFNEIPAAAIKNGFTRTSEPQIECLKNQIMFTIGHRIITAKIRLSDLTLYAQQRKIKKLAQIDNASREMLFKGLENIKDNIDFEIQVEEMFKSSGKEAYFNRHFIHNTSRGLQRLQQELSLTRSGHRRPGKL